MDFRAAYRVAVLAAEGAEAGDSTKECKKQSIGLVLAIKIIPAGYDGGKKMFFRKLEDIQ